MADDKKIRVLYVACRRGCSEDILASTELQSRLEHAVTQASASALEWTAATSQKEALRLVRLRPPRLAIVELDQSARRLSFCRQLRERLPSLKIVVVGLQKPEPARQLDGRASHDNAVQADGYLPLPLDPSYVRSLFTHLLDGYRSSVLEIGPIRLNTDLRLVVTPKGQYHMTPKTTALLYYLMAHHGQVLSRSEIMQNVWETDYLEDTRTLDVHIRWLRERIEADPSEPTYLSTVRGKGYRLRLQD